MIKCKAENQNQKCRFFKNMHPSSWSVNVLQGAKSNYFYTQKAVVFVSAQQPGIFTPYTAVSNIYRLQNRQKKHQLQIAHLLGHWNKRIRRKTSHDLLSFEKEALDFKLKLTESPFLYFPLPFKLAFEANME